MRYNHAMTTGERKMTAPDRRLSVAPMMDWTDRHCRHFHHHVAPDALLFTEMVTADAVIPVSYTHLTLPTKVYV